VDGLLRGNAKFLFVQVLAIVIATVWAFLFTYGMLWLIDRITPVKVDAAGEAAGLDEMLHGERPIAKALYDARAGEWNRALRRPT